MKSKSTGIIMSLNHPTLIINGLKTQTRRTYGLENINQFPDDWRFIRMEGDMAVFLLLRKHPGAIVSIRSRAREIRGKEPNLEFLFKCPYGYIGDELWVKEIWKVAEGAPPLVQNVLYKIDYPTLRTSWKSPLFMPRKFSRISLVITELYPQRLQDISQQDAIEEGYFYPKGKEIERYKEIRDQIDGEKYPCQFNPWVWRIVFGLVGYRLK